jgi:hypothetical protein
MRTRWIAAVAAFVLAAGASWAASDAGTSPAAEPPAAAEPQGVPGPEGQGQVHVVAPGDTLWDISERYLGTPWAWPSIWRANAGISDPRKLKPGDRIWVSANEIRPLAEGESAPSDSVPAAIGDATQEWQPPVAKSWIEGSGFVTVDEYAASTSIVDSPSEHTWLVNMDRIYLGFGQGQAQVGDQFTIFRPSEKVYDTKRGHLFGYAVEVLGWAEVIEVHPESSVAEIRMSFAEAAVGDRAVRRDRVEAMAPREAPQVEGHVVFTPAGRLNMGIQDFVYLDTGSNDGVEVGSPLEVYRPGEVVPDEPQGFTVRHPDEVIAKLLVVRALPQAAVAYVMKSGTEIERGMRVRGATDTRVTLP